LTEIQPWHALWGCEETNSGLWALTPLVNGASALTFYSGYSDQIGSIPVTDNTIYLLECQSNNGILTYECGDVSGEVYPNGSICKTDNIYVFTINSFKDSSILEQASKMRLYYFQIYDNNVLVRDFVPCINASGEAGLYDKANNVFYGNAGSGTFEAGSAISAKNVTISITQASTASDYCYLQIGDTKYTAVQDITVPSGTKITFRALSNWDMGSVLVNGILLYQSDLSVHEYVYMDAITNMSIAFETGGKFSYIHITTEDEKQYTYDTPTSYIVPAKTMTIGGNSYTFEEGMTWGDWIDSSYNTGYNGSLFTVRTALGVFCSIIENNYDMCYQVVYNDSVQSGSDVIVEGREYSFKITSMGPA
jgi:hypothetical protein